VPAHLVPPGRPLDLPGRGTTWIVEHDPIETNTSSVTPILLLHGINGGSGINFSHLYPALAHHRVIALDHRAHGRGIRSPDPTITECAHDAAAVLDALDIAGAAVVGYSMGGAIAQEMWRHHPGHVSALALWATAARFTHGARRRRNYGRVPTVARQIDGAVRGLAGISAKILRVGEMNKMRRPEIAWVNHEVARHDPAGVASLSASLAAFDSRKWVGEIDIPTAVLVTDQDRIVPPERQRELAHLIPHAVQVTFSRAGHSTPMARPDRVVPGAVAAFDALIGRLTAS